NHIRVAFTSVLVAGIFSRGVWSAKTTEFMRLADAADYLDRLPRLPVEGHPTPAGHDVFNDSTNVFDDTYNSLKTSIPFLSYWFPNLLSDAIAYYTSQGWLDVFDNPSFTEVFSVFTYPQIAALLSPVMFRGVSSPAGSKVFCV